MQRRTTRAEQLHLELQYDYLKRLKKISEEVDSYDVITSKFINSPSVPIEMIDNSFWKEINNFF